MLLNDPVVVKVIADPNTDIELCTDYRVNHGVENVSHKKIKGIDVHAEENELLSGYRLMAILLAIIKGVACPKCFIDGSFALVQDATYGLAIMLCVSCNNCKDWRNEFVTSTKKSKKFDIHYKAVYAMRRGKI